MFDLQHTLELIDDGALDEAASALQHAIAQMPAYTPAYVLLAETYEAQDRWSDALATWQQARFFAPNSPTVEAGLLRALDHQDIMPSEVADDAAPDVTPDDVMERMADELIDTLRADENDESDAPPESIVEDPKPITEEPPPHAPTTDPVEPPPPPTPEQDDSDAYQAAHDQDDEERRRGTPPQDTSDEPASDEPATNDDEPSPPSTAPAPPAAQQRPSPLDELASRLPDPDRPLPDDLQDLDRLIDELESARIDPQPDVEDAPAPNLDDDVDDMVSETLARIYIAQEQYAEAARVYTRLAHQDPDRADEYRERAAELREQARDTDQ